MIKDLGVDTSNCVTWDKSGTIILYKLLNTDNQWIKATLKDIKGTVTAFQAEAVDISNMQYDNIHFKLIRTDNDSVILRRI